MANRIPAVAPDKRFNTWSDNGKWRTFDTFDAAERYARKYVAANNASIEISAGLHAVASVRLDALGRVWTDVRDTAFA